MLGETDEPAVSPQGRGRGTNQGGMREANERVILTLLRHNANLAKADIARRTGLSAQTVARLIGALEADGLILRGTPQRGRIGQPSVPLSLNPSGAVFLGLKVGRRSVEMVATDLMGRILDRARQTYDYPDFSAVLDFALTAAETLTKRLAPELRGRVGGLGIAMPFFLWNWAPHIGVDAELMADWEHRDLRAEIADRLPYPVLLQNDATSACSAELVFGDPPLPNHTLCIYIAFFVGGGLVLNGSLFSGATGNAAGLGPLRVPDLSGTIRPLLEIASLGTLEATLTHDGHDSQRMWDAPEGWDFPAPLTDDWIAEAANALAHGLRSVQTVLDLDAVLIDGWMPRAMVADLCDHTHEAVSALDMTGIHRPRILRGSLGADARVLGAASLPLSQRFLVQ